MVSITHDDVYQWVNDGQSSKWDQTQAEFQEALGGAEPKSLSEMDVYDYNNRIGKAKQIRRFPSGAVRSDDRGRVRPDFVSPYAIHEIALHFTVAENDFGATNYYRGILPEDILPSMGRHYLEFQEAVMKGDKAGMRSALRSMGANCVMGLHQIVAEEKGEYKEIYEKTEYVDIEYAKANQ